MENKNQPAYPYRAWDEKNGTYQDCNGLTKREYFAAMAMQGLLAGRNQQSLFISPNNSENEYIIFEQLAADSIATADILLTQLSSPTSSGE